ncbi:MAG: GGDEF domain-containing protein [Lentisphaeria bacterium]|nr:GGDEF domain-containing protein [Candidatus Neomarinimicrobiota bacterium]MCF7841336.1 GGDEF domain-containing protein [Lentisphaeria bacterium]
MKSAISLSGCENVYYYALQPEKKEYSLEKMESVHPSEVAKRLPATDELVTAIGQADKKSPVSEKTTRLLLQSVYTDIPEKERPLSLLYSPIEFNKSHIGFLLFDHHKPDFFTADDIPSVRSLTELLSAQINSFQYLDLFRERCDLYSIMLEVNTHLNVAASKEDFLTEIGRIGKYFLKCDRAIIALRQDTFGSRFIIDAIDGSNEDVQVGDSYPVENTLVGRAIQKGKIQLYKPEAPPPIQGIFKPGDRDSYPFNSAVAFPLNEEPNSTGALVLEFNDPPDIVEMDIKLFGMIGLNLGAALNRLNLYAMMKENATTDALTNVYNSRTVRERLSEEVARARRYQSALTLLFLDLDKFKAVNDTYGHLMGDYVLRDTAKIIKDNVRTGDIVGRYGGEEFVVILINAVAEDVVKTAERIRDCIAKHNFEFEDQVVHIKISIGIAQFPKDGDSEEHLLRSADAAMYETKRKGGNDITLYQPGMQPKYH